jgi:TolB-like protein
MMILATAVLVSACSVNMAEREARFDASANWVVLPLVNFSQTPQAGERAERIAETLLRSQGLSSLRHYPLQESANGLPILDEQKRYANALDWARKSGARYAIAGSVEEWRYKSGLDGEPAVGITLQVIDVDNGDVLWSASGSRAGWSRESLSGTAHKVLEKLVANLEFN